jgi:hypothetical protein
MSNSSTSRRMTPSSKEADSTFLVCLKNQAVNTTISENQNLCLAHVQGWMHSPSSVTIVMDFARKDRLGNQLGRVFKLSLFAHYKKYNFCTHLQSGQKFTEELGIPTCHHYERKCNQYQFIGGATTDQVDQDLKPGYYHYKQLGKHENHLKFFENSNHFVQSAKSKQYREFWRRNLLEAPTKGFFANSSTANQNLFLNHHENDKSTTNIAVHIRRGDITWEYRRDVFIKDIVFIQIIQQVKAIINALSDDGLVGRPVVHVFSEDYGTVNWTAYEGIVDEFHFAPKMNGHEMDWALNIRDWVHFLKADVTVTSSTFSFYPSHFKDDPDPQTGLPVNIHPCRIGGPYGGCNFMSGFQSGIVATFSEWTSWDSNANDTVVTLKNLPSAWMKFLSHERIQ